MYKNEKLYKQKIKSAQNDHMNDMKITWNYNIYDHLPKKNTKNGTILNAAIYDFYIDCCYLHVDGENDRVLTKEDLKIKWGINSSSCSRRNISALKNNKIYNKVVMTILILKTLNPLWTINLG